MSKVTMLVGLLAAHAALCFGPTGCDKPAPSHERARATSTVDAGLTVPKPGTKAVFCKFGPPDSKIEFAAAKVTKKHDGSFRSFEGTVGLVASEPLMSAVQVSIDLASVTTDSEKLSGHLKSGDFFDVAKFPKATFSSTTIRPGDGPSKYNVTGRLDLHGVNKPITFPATIKAGPDGVDADAELTINRKEFGIVYPGMPDDLIRDDVSIKLTIHARPSSGASASGEGNPPADAGAAD